jgi:hypothetical protein
VASDLLSEPCPIGKSGETWGEYWKRRDREEGASIVSEYGRHEVNGDEVSYEIKCGKCGGSVDTDGDYFWHSAPGVEPEDDGEGVDRG